MSKHNTRWKNALVRVAAVVGEHEAYCINNDRITAKRMDKKADQMEEIANQIELWFGHEEECNDNGFHGSCGCAKCLAGGPEKEDSPCLEF